MLLLSGAWDRSLPGLECWSDERSETEREGNNPWLDLKMRCLTPSLLLAPNISRHNAAQPGPVKCPELAVSELLSMSCCVHYRVEEKIYSELAETKLY